MKPPIHAGKVYLVGAGPGDAELLTLKAARVIGMAEVLLVDDLVSDDVLAFANAKARVVYVGKRGGCKSTPQEFIERLMILEAKQGRIVVRLKGGDPFVFGRGGEECDALRTAGIEVEIVNGITAGLAAPTALGIPLTHRDICHGAIFITGHAGQSDDGASTVPNWHALVATGLPLVIYMGVARCESIQRDLIDAGMPQSTPIAIIQNATRRNQRSIITTLAALVADLHASGIGSPAIMVVGETVRHAQIDATMQSASIPHQRETQSIDSNTGAPFRAQSRGTPRQC